MKLRHTSPCNECPWRKEAPAGWMGGHDPGVYADAVQFNEVPACHRQDHGPDDPRTSMCAGALAVAANSATSMWKTPGGDDARKKVGQRADCFRWVRDFYRHHTGEDYQPFATRRMRDQP